MGSLVNSEDYMFHKIIVTRHAAIQWSFDDVKMRRYVALFINSTYVFFLQIFNSTKNPSKSLGKEVVRSLCGISPRMCKRTPPPLPFLSNVIVAAYPSIMNWLEENFESNFVLKKIIYPSFP